MNHHQLKNTLGAIASGDVGAMPSMPSIGIVKYDGQWTATAGQLYARKPRFQDALADILVKHLSDIAARLWLERWEPLIRAGVALMCSVGAARLADALGVSVEDVRGES